MSTTILPSQLAHAEIVRQSLVITAKNEHEPDQYLEPNAYAPIADKIRPHDSITVINENGLWIMELFVVSTARNWVRVVKTGFTDVDSQIGSTEEELPDDEYTVKWRGPNGKWAVIRTSDNSSVSSGHASQEDALKAKNNYVRALSL